MISSPDAGRRIKVKFCFWSHNLANCLEFGFAVEELTPVKPVGAIPFGVNFSLCLNRHSGKVAVKREENPKENLSFKLFPKHTYVPASPEREKISYIQKLYIVALYLWDGALSGAALGKENGFEGGVQHLAGGYRTGLLFSEDVARQATP